MTLDAYTAGVLRLMAAAYPDLGGTVSDAAEARRDYHASRFPAGPPVAMVKNTATPDGVPVRIYWPHGLRGPAPVVVYFHGGGFVLCTLDTHDGICRLLADRASAIVVSVDYRVAPEYPFPAAADDAYTATCWAFENARALGGDPGRLAVAGDSAGGGLAAVTCLRARDLGHPRIAHQLLIYPVTDLTATRTDDLGSLLTARHMTWFTEQYLARPEDAEHPYASPLRAPDLTGLPPALVLTAEHDPLRAEGEAYAARLAAAGVQVSAHNVNGFFHGLFGLGALVPVALEAEDVACAALRQALSTTTETTTATEGMDMDEQLTELYAAIGRVMGEVLVRGPLAPDEDFFQCGGDSLRAIEALQRLGTDPELAGRLGSTSMQALLLEAIFEDASPAGLATVATAHA